MQVGIIGLGLLGKAISRALVDAGHGVFGYDIEMSACEEAQGHGVRVCDSAHAVAGHSTLLILSLMTSEDRRGLLWGDQALAQALQSGTIILDTTTARPPDIVKDNERLEKQAVRLVDVCISGSSQSVLDHEALALIGDSEAGAEPYSEVLSEFTKALFYFDEPGRGNQVKLIVNTVMGLNRLVLAEALGLASKGGFDLEEVLAVLKEGATYSKVMDIKGPQMVSGVYEPVVARLDQHVKDVGLILEYAEGIGADMPVSRLHHELLQLVLEKGAGPLDNASIFTLYSEDDINRM